MDFLTTALLLRYEFNPIPEYVDGSTRRCRRVGILFIIHKHNDNKLKQTHIYITTITSSIIKNCHA